MLLCDRPSTHFPAPLRAGRAHVVAAVLLIILWRFEYRSIIPTGIALTAKMLAAQNEGALYKE